MIKSRLPSTCSLIKLVKDLKWFNLKKNKNAQTGTENPGDTYVVVGLGNPGDKYLPTRHNVGFKVIDLLSEKTGIKTGKLKFKSLYGEGHHNGFRIVLVKPQTFMNNSGECVREIVSWYKASLDHVILVYDEVDISLGTLRIRIKGSAGTHNGMKSVIYHLKSQDFPRIRVGIGGPSGQIDLADYVLGRFTKEELKTAVPGIKLAAQAALCIIEEGIDKAMNKYNKAVKD